jgi:hypothetical protein
METGVSGVHARDAIKASAAANPKSLDDIGACARLRRYGSPPEETGLIDIRRISPSPTCHDECPLLGLA